jgi:hypothetical protein
MDAGNHNRKLVEKSTRDGDGSPAPFNGARLAEARYTAQLADLISEAYVADFKLLQYPLWNGKSAYQDRQF